MAVLPLAGTVCSPWRQVRSGRAVEALAHARRHLSGAAEFEPQLRIAMTSLALGPGTRAAP